MNKTREHTMDRLIALIGFILLATLFVNGMLLTLGQGGSVASLIFSFTSLVSLANLVIIRRRRLS